MAGTVNFRGRQGSVFRRTITVVANGDPMDLTGVGIRMQARRELADVDPELSLELGDGITVADDPTTGVFVIAIDAETMADLNPAALGLHFDLELVPAGDDTLAFALLAGRFAIEAEVTR